MEKKNQHDGLAGSNAPRQQELIRNIIINCYHKKIVAFPEYQMKTKGIVPDIVIEKGLLVEITRHYAVKKNRDKLKNALVEYKNYSEGFVYDYEKGIWFKILINDELKNNSFSDILNCDFNDLINNVD